MAMIDISLVVSDYQALGIDLPPDAVEVLDIWTALREAVDAKPGDDLRALLTDGILTAANAPDRLKEAALVLALKAGMQSLVIDLDRPATIRAKAAFAADAPRVVAELAPPSTLPPPPSSRNWPTSPPPSSPALRYCSPSDRARRAGFTRSPRPAPSSTPSPAWSTPSGHWLARCRATSP